MPWCRQSCVLLALLSLLVIVSTLVYHHLSSHWRTVYSSHPVMGFNKPPPPAQNEIKTIANGIWTLDSGGRLGNQMCEYAALYALAKLHGHRACILTKMFNFLAPIFKINLPLLHDSVDKRTPWRYYQLLAWMSEKDKHIEGQYVKLTGYPMSYKYFDHIRDEIRREFTFHDFIREEALEHLAKLKGSRQNVTYIGVHVRRGDYIAHFSRRWKAVVASKAYVDKAMAYFRKKFQEPVFVVVSNDMSWCKENINASKGDVYFVGNGIESSPEKDFALLAHCNHSIMTVGTFGIWSSFMAGGETIHLTNFSRGDTENNRFHYEDAFLPEWTGIPADL